MAFSTIEVSPTAQTNFPVRFQTWPTCSYILRYKEQIIVNIEQMEDGLWIARNTTIMTHGVGFTCEEALEDYKEMLIDYFKCLVESERALAPHLFRQLELLRTILPEEIIAVG